VPGGFGELTGVVQHFPNGFEQPGVGLANVRLVLVTRGHCPIVGEQRTDADGHFTFRRAPAGAHELYMFPPAGWRVTGDINPVPISVHGGTSYTYDIRVIEGTNVIPVLPTQPPDCDSGTAETPRPQGKPKPAPVAATSDLAETGASVVGLVAVGAGVLAAGIGGVVAARRRKV